MNFASLNLLVVGDVMLDQYWFGNVDRISPEAPVPVLQVASEDQRLGGAANVATNICSLGGQCTLLSTIGQDEAGSNIAQLLASAGVHDALQRADDMKTILKLRMIARNQQLLRSDFDAPPSGNAIAAMHSDFSSRIDNCAGVIFSDYGKGVLQQIEGLIEQAVSRGLPIFIDPKGTDFSRYRHASVITPNLREFELVVGPCNGDLHNMDDKAQSLMQEHDISAILVTMSERGMALFRNAQDYVHSPAQSREVYDVSGAGDTVIAMFALARTLGEDDATAMHWANAAAGVVVSKLGTATATREEVHLALQLEN